MRARRGSGRNLCLPAFAQRFVCAGILALLVGILGTRLAPAQTEQALIRDGEFGLVVSDFNFATSDTETLNTPACPNGPSLSFAEIFLQSHPELTPNDDEGERRFQRLALEEAARARDGQNLCMAPTLESDAHFQTIQGNMPVYGVDLDGQTSRAGGHPAPGTCAHDDFAGIGGNRGVDNQYFRAIGCIRGYQPGGLAYEFSREMLRGTWSILVALKGVESLENDADVEVRLYAGADPIQLGTNRQVLPFATYAASDDNRFRASTRGRIANGVLTTEPVDARFKYSANGDFYERPLRDARLHVTFAGDGSAEGYLSGYSPIDEIFQNQVSFNGNMFVAVAAANAIGYTCHGLYAAFQTLADGNRDPVTGRCTSISTQYRISAVPGFVVD